MQFALSVSIINLIEAMYAEKGRGITALYVRNKVFGEIKPGVNTILAIVDKIKNKGGDAICVKADVSRYTDVKRMIETTLKEYNRIDILVNNAGILITEDVLDTSEDDWDRTIDINLKGAYLCSKEVAPIMLKQKKGKIINMSSNSGLYHPSSMRFTEYVVSKAGMNALSGTIDSCHIAQSNVKGCLY